jgi:CheY-like chemotaxis protein
VAKILVADDNSNIQKMVGLALKDQGIEVLAVGNGEAAVRKISDLKPDLVLADVFMPVRNGYEVCQYVKADASLSHIPVILLVGAFDPLDEQEAQRVGADGVLKKPFVPPDPLISMVKSALTRAGVLFGASAEKVAEVEAAKGTDFPAAPGVAVPKLSNAGGQETAAEPVEAIENEDFVDETPREPAPLQIASGSQPLAFGSLLETPAADDEQDPTFVAPVHPELAERDWRGKDEEEIVEEEEEHESGQAWRVGSEPIFGDVDSSATGTNWGGGGFEQLKSKRTEYERWEAGQENPDVEEAAKTTPEVSAVVSESRETTASLQKIVPALPAAPLPTDTWAPGLPLRSPQANVTETVTAVEEAMRTSIHEESSPEATVASPPEGTPQEAEQKPASSSWFSAASSPWDAEVEKANRLASAWDAAVQAPIVPAVIRETETVSDEGSEASKQAALPAAAAQVAEHAAQSAPRETGAEAGTAAAPMPSMDDLVSKVLANMSPDALQAVTREILRPVVEAMVKEELESKSKKT